MDYKKDFDHIRPYHDHEINPALVRIINSPEFTPVVKFLFPDKPVDELKDLLSGIHTSGDFQIRFMHSVVRSVLSKTADNLSFDGFDKLDPNVPYLFISNHRDIVLDSAILQSLLVDHSLPTSEITFGDILMMSPFIIDFGKCNKMFTVFRGGSRLEIMKNSILLSSYIRHTITEKKNSIWIAQRNGRTKDGHDKTEEALLKMLGLSSKKRFDENLSELNIIPLTISYEFEPCGFFKAKELLLSKEGKYEKETGEDFTSILSGITQPKGRIHLCAGNCLNEELKTFPISENKNSNFERLALLIDKEIYKNYKLWPSNYIAYDLSLETSRFSGHYSQKEKENFLKFINSDLHQFSGDKKDIESIYLKIYSNPVTNQNL